VTLESFVRQLRSRPIPWDSVAAEQTFAQIQVRTQSKPQGRSLVWLTAAALALVASGAWLLFRPAPSAPKAGSMSPQHTTSEVRSLPDSSVALLSPGAELRITEETPARMGLTQARGKVEYRVTPGLPRKFVVTARDVTVEVVGTVFTITLEPQSTRVSVSHGKVKVIAQGQVSLLSDAQQLVLPLPAARPLPSADGAPAPTVESQAQPAAEARPTGSAASQPGGAHPLLQQADAARRAGDLPRAIAALEKFVQGAPGDARVASSSFTLGRLYRQTGSNQAAAAAFRRAYQRDTSGALAEDARAQEIEALAAAGAWDTARPLAHEYLTRFPSGRYRSRIARLAQ